MQESGKGEFVAQYIVVKNIDCDGHLISDTVTSYLNLTSHKDLPTHSIQYIFQNSLTKVCVCGGGGYQRFNQTQPQICPGGQYKEPTSTSENADVRAVVLFHTKCKSIRTPMIITRGNATQHNTCPPRPRGTWRSSVVAMQPFRINNKSKTWMVLSVSAPDKYQRTRLNNCSTINIYWWMDGWREGGKSILYVPGQRASVGHSLPPVSLSSQDKRKKWVSNYSFDSIRLNKQLCCPHERS